MSFENADKRTEETTDVTEMVTKKIEAIGEGMVADRKKHDELSKSVFDLRELVESGREDPSAVEEYVRLSDDITTRQAEIDTRLAKMGERVDSIETAFQRPGGALANIEGKEEKEALIFALSTRGFQGQPLSREEIKSFTPDIGVYNEYKTIFDHYFHSDGDERSMGRDELKAMQIGKDPDGGFLVVPEMAEMITTSVREADPIQQLAKQQSISKNSLEIPLDNDTIRSGWESEKKHGPETGTPKMGKTTITTNTVYASPLIPYSFLEDASINVEEWLSDKVSEEFAQKEGEAFIKGDGVKKPRGFLTHDSGTKYGQVEQVKTGAAEDITADSFIKLKYALKEGYLTKGTWLMNRLTVAAIMRLKNNNGDYLWKPGLAHDNQSMILGLPVRMSPSMPLIVANSLPVAIADWKKAYLIVKRLGISLVKDPFSSKPFIEFYFRERVGGKLVNYEAIKLLKTAA
ncbi:MAG: phage major capsid protein [bacterium]|nr:phage major capsid protein [bacterium]